MTFWETVLNWITTTGVKIVIAVVIMIVAFKLINLFCNKLSVKLQTKGKLDRTITKTLCHAAKIALKVLVVVCLVGYLGIETSGISAVIASLGVCVGLAVNGTLSNLAGGVMIILTRPFKLGDYISAQGSEGTVEDIRICYTKIKTVDNKIIYIPNSGLSTSTIVNYSEDALRRVDIDFSVGGNDPVKVRELLLDICAENEMIIKSPEPFARMTDYGAGNGITVTLRVWCNTEDYWDVKLNLLDSVQKKFEAEGIVIPFNQLDVHMK